MAWRSTMKMGSSGDDVREFQKSLADQGYYKGAIDGIFGKQTREAVSSYQKDKNLVIDGIAGPQTQGSIKDAPVQKVDAQPAAKVKKSGEPQYIYPDEYTIEEIQDNLDYLYSTAKAMVKQRSTRTKKIIVDAEDIIKRLYIKEGENL